MNVTCLYLITNKTPRVKINGRSNNGNFVLGCGKFVDSTKAMSKIKGALNAREYRKDYRVNSVQ